MAFIRWKKNKFGIRQAYLVHSYRDGQGKPKHKTLAYLGREGQVNAEQLVTLKDKHKEWDICWEKIQSIAHPKPQTDISQLNDEELLRRLNEIRTERSLSVRTMLERLSSMGATAKGWRDGNMTVRIYCALEKGWAMGLSKPHYLEPGRDLAPAIRKVLEL